MNAQHMLTSTSVGIDIYPHMPNYVGTSTCRTIFHKWHISSVTFTLGLPLVNFTARWLADSSDFGLGEAKVKSSPKCHERFPAQDTDEPQCKI